MENDQLTLTTIETAAKIGPVSLEFKEDVTLAGWADVGKKLCRTTHMLQWWVCDWAAFGERKFGKLAEFATVNRLNLPKLREYAAVSEAVQLPLRKEGLDWAYYKEIAGLPKNEQAKWLKASEEKQLTLAELRAEIRKDQGETHPEEQDKPIGLDCLRWRDCLVHWFKTRPEGFWTTERKAVWRKELDPIVQFYHSLGV